MDKSTAIKGFHPRVRIALLLAAGLGGAWSTEVLAQPKRETIALAAVDYPPFVFKDGTGAGVDMVKEVLRESGYEVAIQTYPLGRAISMVNKGEVQAAFLFPQTDPELTVAIPLYYAGLVFAFKRARFPKGVRFTALSELQGYRIGALVGSQWSIKHLQEEAGLDLDFAQSNDMNVKKLYVERVDLVVLVDLTARAVLESVFQAKRGEFELTAPFAQTPLCLVLSKTHPGSQVVIDRVRQTIADISMPDVIQRHFGRYFPGGEVPRRVATGRPER